MSKVRVIVADYEGSEEGVLALVRALLPAKASDAQVFVSAPATAALVLEAPAQSKAPRKGKPAKTRRAVQSAAAAPEPVEVPQYTPGGAADLVRACLQKKPMVSGDLIKATKATAPAVYTALTALRRAGLVETRDDPEDGQRKNYLVG